MTPKEAAAHAAGEEAIIEVQQLAMSKARRLGWRSPTLPGTVYTDPFHTKVQARCLITDALLGLHSQNACERRVLAALRAIDRSNADDHEAVALLWREIKEAAETEEESEWFYSDNEGIPA